MNEFGQLVWCLREAPGKSLLLAELRERAPAGLRRLAQDAAAFRASLRAISGPVRVSGPPGSERVSLELSEGPATTPVCSSGVALGGTTLARRRAEKAKAQSKATQEQAAMNPQAMSFIPPQHKGTAANAIDGAGFRAANAEVGAAFDPGVRQLWRASHTGGA